MCVVFDLKFRIAQFIYIFIHTIFCFFRIYFEDNELFATGWLVVFNCIWRRPPLSPLSTAPFCPFHVFGIFIFFFNFVFLAYSDKVLRFVFRALHRIANGMCVVCDIAVKLYYRVNIRLPVNLCLAVCCFIWNWLFLSFTAFLLLLLLVSAASAAVYYWHLNNISTLCNRTVDLYLLFIWKYRRQNSWKKST